jgi:hypothetical protein
MTKAQIALCVATTCWLSSAAFADGEIFSIAVVDMSDKSIGVASAVLSGTAALQQEATTDLNGKLQLQRNCKVGEQIQANPIEEVVYEPSGPVGCAPDLVIEVRRRTFGDSGVAVFSLAGFTSPSGEQRLAITKVGLQSSSKDVASGAGDHCLIEFKPIVSTALYGEKNLDSTALARFDENVGWADVAQTVTLGTPCADSVQRIIDIKAQYAKDITGKAVAEGIGSGKWLEGQWKGTKDGAVLMGVENIGGYEQFCNVAGCVLNR